TSGYIDVVDATGKVLCSAKAAALHGRPFAETSVLLRSIARRARSTEAPIADPFTRLVSMYSAVPLRTHVPASLIVVDDTQSTMAPLDPDKTFESLLIDTRSVTVLMRYPKLD